MSNPDQFDPNPLPTEVGSDWVVYSAPPDTNWQTEADVDCADGMRLETSSGSGTPSGYVYFTHESAGTEWVDNISNSTGYTIETRMEAADLNPTKYCSLIYSADGTYEWAVRFLGSEFTDVGKIELPDVWISGGSQEYSIPLSGVGLYWAEYHIIRVTAIGSVINIYLDNDLTPIITATLDNAVASKRIYWNNGDSSGNGTSARWDYIHYTTEGAFGPSNMGQCLLIGDY